jgi:hypothetical protein
MSSWTPGGGWFSNNRIVYAIVAFLSESIAKCFKHKKVQQKIPQFNSSSAVVFLLLLCVIFVPAILVTSIAVNVLTFSILALIVYSIIYLINRKPVDFLLLEFYFWFWVLGCLFCTLIAAHSFLTQNRTNLGQGLEIIFLSLSMSNLIRNLKTKEWTERPALVQWEEMNDLKTYFLSNISHECVLHWMPSWIWLIQWSGRRKN